MIAWRPIQIHIPHYIQNVLLCYQLRTVFFHFSRFHFVRLPFILVFFVIRSANQLPLQQSCTANSSARGAQ